MKRLYLSAVAFLCGMALAQPAEKPEFLLADVHSSPRTTQPVVRGPFYTLFEWAGMSSGSQRCWI